jgi:hypothetical protein
MSSASTGTLSCSGKAGVYKASATATAVWVYQGSTAGYVRVNTTGAPPPPMCPSASDAAWN